MRYWTDESGIRMCEPNTADEWLKFIWEIGFDYDGETTVEGLKGLIDEIIEISFKARTCIEEGRIK